MTEWLAVITITIFAVISPGPDFAMVSRNSLLLNRRAGVLTAIGIALGVFVHVGYTLLGVGLIIRETPMLFHALKLLGALYLIWLGARMLLPRKSACNAGTAPVLADRAALRTGFFTNVLNPKTTVFIVSLFLQVVGPSTSVSTQIAYGVFISLAHAVWFGAVALFFSSPAIQNTLLAVRHWIDRAFGTVLVGFGIALANAGLGR